MQKPDRRAVLGGIVAVAGVGMAAGFLPSRRATEPVMPGFQNVDRDPMADRSPRYVFASDPRAADPAYKVMPG